MGSSLSIAPAQGVYTLIGTTTLTNGQASVTTGTLTLTGYKQIYVRVVCTLAASNELYLQINSDSTAGNYVYEYLQGSTATASANAPGSATYFTLGAHGTNTSATEIWIDIVSGAMPHIKSIGGKDTIVKISCGNYTQTTAISTLTFASGGSTFVTGSYAEIYGVI